MSADVWTGTEYDADRYDQAHASEPDFDLPDTDDEIVGDTCWHCNGEGVIPTGGHDINGEDIERLCAACDGAGVR